MQDKQVLKILCHGVSKTQFDYTCCIEGPEGGRLGGHKGQALVLNNIPLKSCLQRVLTIPGPADLVSVRVLVEEEEEEVVG